MRLRAKLGSLLVSVLFLLGGGQISGAAEVLVSSGEHEDFSRLVLRFEKRVDWQFGKVAGGFEFRSADEDVTFRLRSVFDLIPRDRIQEVQDRGNGRLFLAAECDCYGDAFDLRGGEVVLDIKDGSPIASARRFNRNLPDLPGLDRRDSVGANSLALDDRAMDSRATDASVLSLGTAEIPVITTETAPAAQAQHDTYSGSLQQARQGLPLFLTMAGSAAANSSTARDSGSRSPEEEHRGQGGETRVPEPDNTPRPPETTDETSPSQERVAQTEMALLEQIGRAAAQGLLEANISQTERMVRQATDPLGEDLQTGRDEAELSQQFPDPPAGSQPHVAVMSAIDRGAAALNAEVATTLEGETCLDDSLFDVAAWGGEIENGAQLGNFRTKLLGEFDTARPEAVLTLARHYIYLTFGAEAKALVTTYESAVESAVERPDILLILAEIMDERHSVRGGNLAKYMACGGKVALWAALAQSELRPGQEINTSAIVATFSELPIHLRRYLGPALASRLIDVGDEETAESLQIAINRAAGDSGAGAVFLEAQMAISQGRPQKAIEALGDVITSDSELAPEAILELIEFKIDQGIEVTESEITIAASHAFELRGTEIGQALIRAEIAALAENGYFSEAFTRFDQYKDRGDIKPESEQELLISLFENLTQSGADAPFLRYMIGLSAEFNLPADIRRAAAARLISLGFADAARALLGRSAQVPDHQERLLFAQIALEEGRYDVALGYLAGMDDPPAETLRAQALMGKEDFLAAAQLFENMGDAENQIKSAWRAGDWEQVAAMDQSSLGRASSLMMAPHGVENAFDPQTEVLEADAALLVQSQETRDVISELLGRFSVP